MIDTLLGSSSREEESIEPVTEGIYEVRDNIDVPEGILCDSETQTDSTTFEKKCAFTQTESSRKIQKRSVGTYYNYYGTIQTKEVGNQADLIQILPLTIDNTELEMQADVEADESFTSMDNDSDLNTSLYEPSQDEIDQAIEDAEEADVFMKQSKIPRPSPNSAFIVFWSQLVLLLNRCLVCASPVTMNFHHKGSMITVIMTCNNNHTKTWYSQPMIGKGAMKYALGNVRLVCGTLLSGATFSKLSEIFKFSGIQLFAKDTFYRIQKRFVAPVVNLFWREDNLRVLQMLRNGLTCKIAGDARCDSPGHNAKYSTYSFINQATGHIVASHLTQVTECGNANRMEKHGFIKALNFLKEGNVTINQVTTDRHVQVRKYLKDNEQEIDHQFDPWHVCKGIKKKLFKLAKKAANRELGYWIKAICNHFWWSAATCEGNAEILREKWTSIIHHICGKHSWTANNYFHKCAHTPYTRAQSRKKKWLKSGSPAHEALKSVVFGKNLLRDLPRLTRFSHTGGLEVFHALFTKYAPKRSHFWYEGMLTRSQLAILDHNNNVGSTQALTKSGTPRYSVSFTKATKSWVAKPIARPKDKTIFHAIAQRVVEACNNDDEIELPNVPKLAKNIATVKRLKSKEDIVKQQKSRFIVNKDNSK